jgi:elongation factor P
MESGKALEHTFKINETIEKANIETTNAQYLYNDGTNYVFMDNSTYEQFELADDLIGDMKGYMVDDMGVMLVKHDGQPISVRVPQKVQLKVVEAPPGVKGDSSAGATKQVTLETGIHLQVPLFIKEDDVIVVNTETGDYVERV